MSVILKNTIVRKKHFTWY